MSLMSNSTEERNYGYMIKIITDIISAGLRTIFKQEWNNRYQATVAAWDDTTVSGQHLYRNEKSRPSAKNYLTKYRNGNSNKWDCTALFDAILYSKSIGKSGLSAAIYDEVDNLRNVRNEILHDPQGRLTEQEFKDASGKVRCAFRALGLSVKEIDKIKIERVRVSSFQVLPPQPHHKVIHRSPQVSTVINNAKELHSKNDEKLTYCYISGNPGSGKSQLARQIGETYYSEIIAKKEALTFVMTLNAKSLDALLESYEDFARRLNFPEDTITSIVNSNQTTEQKIRKFRTAIGSRIKTYTSWLIIIDNVESLGDVSPFLPQLGNEEWNGGQVLVTTQDSQAIPSDSPFVAHVSVSPGMEETESCNLLANLSGSDADHTLLCQVAKQLDYQPLALAAAGVYFNQVIKSKVTPKFSWHDYLRKLKEGKRHITEKRLRDINPAYSETMTTAVLLAVEKSAEKDVILEHTFNFLSLASNESLPLEIAVNYTLLVDKNQDKEDVGIQIRNCSLIMTEENNDVYIRLHRVVHDAIKIYASGSKTNGDKDRWCEAAAESFYQFKSMNNDRTLVPHLNEFCSYMKKNNAFTSGNNKSHRSSEFAQMFSYFGSVLRHFGEFKSSKQFSTAALDIIKSVSGDDDLNVAPYYTNLGSVCQDLGELREAQEYLEKALKIEIENPEPNHVNVACTYGNLGSVFQDLGELELAEEKLNKAVKLLILHLEPRHVDVATGYANLGSVYDDQEKLEQAIECHEKALDIEIELLGTDHVNVATSYGNLGDLYEKFDDLQKAKEYHKKALKIELKQLGPKHVNVATSFGNLGGIHRKLGDLVKAKQYHEKALKIEIEKLGRKHVNVATTYGNLGDLYEDSGDLEKAKIYHDKALKIELEKLGPDHPNVATSFDNLGRVCEGLGKLQEAEKCYKKALKIQLKKSRPSHHDVEVASTCGNLGRVYKASNRLQEAKDCHEMGRDFYFKHQEPDHVGVAICYGNLALVYESLGDLLQVQQYLEQALYISARKLEPGHSLVTAYYGYLALVYQALAHRPTVSE